MCYIILRINTLSHIYPQQSDLRLLPDTAGFHLHWKGNILLNS